MMSPNFQLPLCQFFVCSIMSHVFGPPWKNLSSGVQWLSLLLLLAYLGSTSWLVLPEQPGQESSTAWGCGSAFIFCGSGSISFSQCWFWSDCFLNADPALKMLVKNYLMKTFSVVEKNIKDCSKVFFFKQWSRGKFTLKTWIKKLQLSPIFFEFFLFLLFKFHLLDPDSEGKINADQCGSGFTALLNSIIIIICIYIIANLAASWRVANVLFARRRRRLECWPGMVEMVVAVGEELVIELEGGVQRGLPVQRVLVLYYKRGIFTYKSKQIFLAIVNINSPGNILEFNQITW